MDKRSERGRSLASAKYENNFTGKISGPPAKSQTPEELGRAVVTAMRRSQVDELYACEIVAAAMTNFEPDRNLLARFGKVLVDGSIIHQLFRPDGQVTSKLSMLRTVGQHVELLRKPHIGAHLHGGYSVQYQAVLLYKKLGGDETKFTEILQRNAGRVTRELLIGEAELAKNTAAKKTSDGPAPESIPKSPTNPGIGKADFVLITPGPADFIRLKADYVDREVLPRCLRLHKLLAEEAAAAILAPLAELPVVATKLLPHVGLRKITHLYLTNPPTEPDLINSQVLITAEGRINHVLTAIEDGWNGSATMPLTPTELATVVAPKAKNKLHVFAAAPTDGWDCILERDAWSEEEDRIGE